MATRKEIVNKALVVLQDVKETYTLSETETHYQIKGIFPLDLVEKMTNIFHSHGLYAYEDDNCYLILKDIPDQVPLLKGAK